MIRERVLIISTLLKPSNHAILGSWRFWLVLASIVVIVSAAFNWNWLIAVGVAPLLLTLLPCAVMCALGLCLMKKADANCNGACQEAPDRASHAHPEGHSP